MSREKKVEVRMVDGRSMKFCIGFSLQELARGLHLAKKFQRHHGYGENFIKSKRNSKG